MDRTDANNNTSSSLFWSNADECAHYAALGCHIASIARYFVPPKNDKSKGGKNKKSRVNSDCSTTPNISALHASCLECKEDMYNSAMQHHPWLLGIEHFDPSEYDPNDLLNFPEVAMNDGVLDDDSEDDFYDDHDRSMTLTLTNITQDTIKVYIVSVYDVDLCDAAGNVLKSGKASKTIVDTATSVGDDFENGDGTGDELLLGGGRPLKSNPYFSTFTSFATTTSKERKCTTFIVLCPPQTYVHLCSLAPNQQVLSSSSSDVSVPITSWSQVEIESDVQAWSYHPNTDDEHPYLMHFPFSPGRLLTDCEDYSKIIADSTPAYQCTQSENGQLTHFFHGNYHAIDFACPVGTPLYSAVNGKVVEVRDGGNNASSDDPTLLEVSGIAVRNMFYWNSIMVQAEGNDGSEDEVMVKRQQQEDGKDGSLYVEFVHIQSNSCVVQVGDVVKKGQLLCWSGSVGFSPEPHLHFAAYRSGGKDAATVRVRFEFDHDVLLTKGEEDGVGDDGEETMACTNDGGNKAMMASSFLPRAGGWYNSCGLVLE